MKKTIAALFCLSMIASAGQDFPVTHDGSSPTSYTFDFAIESSDDLHNGTVLALMYYSFSTGGDLVNGLKFQVDNVTQAITLFAGQGSMREAYNNQKQVPEISSSTVFTEGSAAERRSVFLDSDSVAVVLSRDIAYRVEATKGTFGTHEGWQSLTLSQINVDGTTTLLGTAGFNGNVNGGGGGTVAMNSLFNSAYMTPEPATATLSLLALAGLAARRRR